MKRTGREKLNGALARSILSAMSPVKVFRTLVGIQKKVGLHSRLPVHAVSFGHRSLFAEKKKRERETEIEKQRQRDGINCIVRECA
jgi:hypothetical protein